MRAAIRSARMGMCRGHGGPFGAAILKGGRIIATAHNTVLKSRDATCHAEINAIREVSRKLKTPFLRDATIYSTTEPCPMCFAAIHWAQIPKIVYGTSIADVRRRGFNELPVSNARLKIIGRSPVQIRKNFLRAECAALLKEWDVLESRQTY